MNFRTISQLPSCDNSHPLKDNDLFEVSKEVMRGDLQTYQSYNISYARFSEEIRDKVVDKLTDDSDPFGHQHNLMWDWLQRIVLPEKTPIDLSGSITFTNNPKSTAVISSFSEYDLSLVNVETLRNFSRENSPLFIDDTTEFNTSYFNVENNLTLSTDEAPSVNGEKHNAYLFRIMNTTSNEWKATSSGIFTCYGWVDEEMEGPPDNSRRWIALEGYINGGWKILQLQPVIPNLYCSYVGFTFPVGKGLRMRLKTGFKVGTNSNKYQSTQGSLTNHIANAFVGGVYREVSFFRGSVVDPRIIESIADLDKLKYNSSTTDIVTKVNKIIEALNPSTSD